MLTMMEGADPSRVALLCLFHDSQETRVGDIPHIGRKYLRAAPNQEVTADQVANAHPAARAAAGGIVGSNDEDAVAELIEEVLSRR